MSDFEQEHMKLLNVLRDETRKLSPEQEAKINSLLDAQEIKNQAKLKEIQEKANKTEQLENRLNSIEADLKRGLSGEEKQAKTQELKSFEQLLLKGNIAIRGTEEQKYLQERNNEQGGYLAPVQYANEIIKKITEVSPVRSVARIITTSAKEIKVSSNLSLLFLPDPSPNKARKKRKCTCVLWARRTRLCMRPSCLPQAEGTI